MSLDFAINPIPVLLNSRPIDQMGTGLAFGLLVGTLSRLRSTSNRVAGPRY